MHEGYTTDAQSQNVRFGRRFGCCTKALKSLEDVQSKCDHRRGRSDLLSIACHQGEYKSAHSIASDPYRSRGPLSTNARTQSVMVLPAPNTVSATFPSTSGLGFGRRTLFAAGPSLRVFDTRSAGEPRLAGRWSTYGEPQNVGRMLQGRMERSSQ